MFSSQPEILRILRIKFISMNMLLAAIVLFGAFGTICYIDYSNRLNTIYDELDLVLSDAVKPKVPQISGIQQLTEGDAYAVNDSNELIDGSDNIDTSVEYSVPMIGNATAERGSTVVLVAVYKVSPNGIYTVVGDYTNAAMPESVILGANDIVLQSGNDQGFIEAYNLYFERARSPENPRDFIVAYADGTTVEGWTNLAITLMLVGLACLVALFFINIFFSRWALRPVAISIKQQQQFTADASHELKTPLTVILANMAILKSQTDDSVGSQMQWIDSTHAEAERMQLLVNDMLALSRPEGQKVVYATEEIDFSELVEGEVLQFESVAFELGVEMDSSIAEGLMVTGNRDRLARMIATLIDNACKYASKSDDEDDGADVVGDGDVVGSSDGADDGADADDDATDKVRASDAPLVSVTLAQGETLGKHASAILTVHNNGPSIPEEDLPHIFNRFYRADKVRTSSKGGYGLGLAIGQEIAHEHNGNITVVSAANEGATFTVTLPLAG